MGSSTSDGERTTRVAAGATVVAVVVLLVIVVSADLGSIGLTLVAAAVVTALVAAWSIGRARQSSASGDAVVPGQGGSERGGTRGAHTDNGGGGEPASAFVVSLARRNGGLVDQQLALLDTFEASVDDPELLANYFKLDHLATRMRRNADSLLVLAGVERPGFSSPQDIDEVVRAGISEIEDYRRIDVLALDDVQVVGNAARTLGHLIAELLDNATAFSPSEARVRVAGNSAPTGYEIIVADSGIGISDASIDELNRTLALPPQFGALGSAGTSSFGLTVVSMLAARIGAAVRLSGSEHGGTVATVHIPSSVLHVAEEELAPFVEIRVVDTPLASAQASDDRSPAAMEAANAVAKLTLTLAGLPIRPVSTMSSGEPDNHRVDTTSHRTADGDAVFWPPPAGLVAPDNRLPPPPLRTALGPLQVAESSDPRPVVAAHPDRIGAALASFARQRGSAWDAPAVPDRATS